MYSKKCFMIAMVVALAAFCFGEVTIQRGARRAAVTERVLNESLLVYRVLDINALEFEMAEGGESNNGWATAKLYDFPKGRVLIHGAMVTDMSIVFDEEEDISATAAIHVGIGSAAYAPTGTNDDLAGTQVNIIPKLTAQLADHEVEEVTGALAAAAQLDGTTNAISANLNLWVADGSITDDSTGHLSGQVIIVYTLIGDYK